MIPMTEDDMWAWVGTMEDAELGFGYIWKIGSIGFIDREHRV